MHIKAQIIVQNLYYAPKRNFCTIICAFIYILIISCFGLSYSRFPEPSDQ